MRKWKRGSWEPKTFTRHKGACPFCGSRSIYRRTHFQLRFWRRFGCRQCRSTFFRPSAQEQFTSAHRRGV